MPKACLQLISKDPTKKLSVSDKNIFNFLSPSLKLHSQYCHTENLTCNPVNIHGVFIEMLLHMFLIS